MLFCLLDQARNPVTGFHPLRRLVVLPFLIGALSAYAGDQEAARLYYARLAQHRAAEQTLGHSSSIASGIVRNSVDEPVAGATVLVIRVRMVDGHTKFDELAKGTTDDSGRFAIAARTRPKDDIGLEVHAPGFMIWRRWAGGTVEGESIVLNRIIDDAYFADVEREGDPVRRSSLLLDLVGRRAFNSYDFDERIEQYYSHLGSVREDLLAIAESQSFAAVDDDHGESPAQRAKNLLVYWFDPEDESLIRQWTKEDDFKRFRLDLEGHGASPGEALSAYAEAHFTREPKTFHSFTDLVFSPDCKHAYVVFVVRYAYWGYWQPLVLLDERGGEGDQWKVKLAGEGGTWHGLSPDGPAMVYPK
jgi:hypothetical protein